MFTLNPNLVQNNEKEGEMGCRWHWEMACLSVAFSCLNVSSCLLDILLFSFCFRFLFCFVYSMVSGVLF